MKAILLAAGLGTRLRPLTDSTPKCLVPIKGKPLLGIWLDRLTEAGVGPFLVNTHYLADQVETFIAASRHRDRVTLVHESSLLGTARTLLENLDVFEGGDGMLVHADNYCLANLDAFVRAHEQRPAQCLMTMMTFRTGDPSSCGIVEVDADGVVRAFHEKVANPPGNLANGAVYILSAKLLERLASDMRGVTDFSTEVLPGLVGRIFTHETRAAFQDIGTPEAYEAANA